METIRQNQIELREIKKCNRINAFTGFISRLDRKDERRGELKDISIETTQTEKQGKNRVCVSVGGRREEERDYLSCSKYHIVLTYTVSLTTFIFL